jgi:hypothetical protein
MTTITSLVTSMLTHQPAASKIFRVISRNKTDGSYTNCPRMDENCTDYGNRVEMKEFDNIDLAIKWIVTKGDKSRIYYIVEKYDHSKDLHHKGDLKFDCGDSWFVRQRYAFTKDRNVGSRWMRLCLTTSTPHIVCNSRRHIYTY